MKKLGLVFGVCIALSSCLFSCGSSETECSYEEAEKIFNSYQSKRSDSIKNLKTSHLEWRETLKANGKFNTMIKEGDITKGNYYYYEYTSYAGSQATETLITKSDDHYEENGNIITEEKAKSSAENGLNAIINFAFIVSFPSKDYIDQYTFYKLSDNSLKFQYNTIDNVEKYTSCMIMNPDGLITYLLSSGAIKEEVVNIEYNTKLNKKSRQ